MDEGCSGQLIGIRVILVIESGGPKNQRRKDRRQARVCGWHFDAPMVLWVPRARMEILYSRPVVHSGSSVESRANSDFTI